MKKYLSAGWINAFAGAIIVFACCNLQYTFGIFLIPLINKFSWSRGEISLSVSLRSLLSSLVGPLAGGLADKYGAKKLIIAGIILCGLGYLLLTQITQLWHLYIVLSIIIGLGVGLAYVPMTSILTKYFGSKASVPMGILTSGFSMAQIILPPLITGIIIKHGIQTGFLTLGIMTWVVGLLGWCAVKTAPSSTVNDKSAEGNRETETSLEHEEDYTLRDVLHNRSFWQLFFIYFIVATSFQMVAIHIAAAASDVGISAENAALILTFMGFGNTFGRLFLNILTIKLGHKTKLAIYVAVQATVLFLLAGNSELWVYYVLITLLGVASGGTVPVVLTVTGYWFSSKSVGVVIGTIVMAYMAGSTVGPFLAGFIFDVTDSYYIPFSAASAALLLAFIACLLLKPPQRTLTF